MDKVDAGVGAETGFNGFSVGRKARAGFSLLHVRGMTGKFRLFGHYVHVQFLLLALFELTTIFSISLATHNHFIVVADSSQYYILEIGAKLALMAAVFVMFLVAMGLYDTRQRERLSGLIMRLIAALFFAAVTMAVLYQFLPSLSVGDGLVKASAVASVVSLAVIRALFYKFVDGRVLLRPMVTGVRAFYNSEAYLSFL